MEECDEHPDSLEEVIYPRAVSSRALQLVGDLGELVRQAPKKMDRNANFKELRIAFSRSESVQLSNDEDSLMVANVPLPSNWIIDYKLRVGAKGLHDHAFDVLVHFGEGHFTPEHFEECAAATYGCLLHGQKEWAFKGPLGEQFLYVQEEGYTVYVPPGWLHSVKTLSNGAILVGETVVTTASLAAFVHRAASLVNVPQERRHNPEPEARFLCERFGIRISKNLQRRTTDWYAGPAMTALRRFVASTTGGTRRLDKLGRKKRRKIGAR